MFRKSDVRRKSIVTLALLYDNRKIVVRRFVNQAPGIQMLWRRQYGDRHTESQVARAYVARYAYAMRVASRGKNPGLVLRCHTVSEIISTEADRKLDANTSSCVEYHQQSSYTWELLTLWGCKTIPGMWYYGIGVGLCVRTSAQHCKIVKQVCVEPSPSALNMTLPAFAAERRRMEQTSIDSWYAAPADTRARAQHQTNYRMPRCCCRSTGQTDRRTDGCPTVTTHLQGAQVSPWGCLKKTGCSLKQKGLRMHGEAIPFYVAVLCTVRRHLKFWRFISTKHDMRW